MSPHFVCVWGHKKEKRMSRRTSRSQYRIRYGQPLGIDGVSVDLTVILCVTSATTEKKQNQSESEPLGPR
jgi:hypothetical protein